MCILFINYTAISCSISALMVFVTSISLFQNHKQLKIIKEQRKEDIRARLTFEIVSYQKNCLLKISNIGKETAYNININIQSELIDNHYFKTIKENFKYINEHKINMIPGRIIYYYLSSDYAKEGKYKNSPIKITGTYCNQYKIDENFSIASFIPGKPVIVKDHTSIALEEISKSISSKNNSYNPPKENFDVMTTITAKKI